MFDLVTADTLGVFREWASALVGRLDVDIHECLQDTLFEARLYQA
jgi:hypothetical protein